MSPVQILIIDDHTLMRRGLIALVDAEADLEVVGDAADAHEGIKKAAQLQPDIILLDLHMPGINGVQAIPALRDACPAARVLMLTVSEDADDLVGALRAGADGYLLKNIESEVLIASIHRALNGEAVISERMTGKLVSELRSKDPAAGQPMTAIALSPRENEIALLIAQGASNKEIARRLGVAESTVKIHVQHILRKLELTSRVQIAVYASENGLAARTLT
ncbi:MAG TPA: response regulator [Burkholderiales bacterium]|nr:response regulator [Burkholderiales bacterium]